MSDKEGSGLGLTTLTASVAMTGQEDMTLTDTDRDDGPEWDDPLPDDSPDEADPLQLDTDDTDDTADPADGRQYRGHRPNAGLSDLTAAGHGWMTDRHLDRFDPAGLDLDDHEPEALDVTPVRRNECPHCGDRLYPEATEYVCRFADVPRTAPVMAVDGPTAPVPVVRPTDPAPVFRDAWNVPAPWANPDRGRSRAKDDPHGWTRDALSVPPYWTPDPVVKTDVVIPVRAEPRPVLAVPAQFDGPIQRCPVVALIGSVFDEREDCQCSPCVMRRNPPFRGGRPRVTCGKPQCVTTQDTKTTRARRHRDRVNDRLRAKAKRELSRYPFLRDAEIGERLGMHRNRVAEARGDAPGPATGERWTYRPGRPAVVRPPKPVNPSKTVGPSWFGPVVSHHTRTHPVSS